MDGWMGLNEMDLGGWIDGWGEGEWYNRDQMIPCFERAISAHWLLTHIQSLPLRLLHQEIWWNLTVTLQLIQLTFFQKGATPGTHLMSLFLSRCKFKRSLATWRNLFPLRYPAWTSPRNTRKCLSCVRQNHFRQSCCYCLKPQGTSCNLITDVRLTTVSFCAFNLQNKRLV